MNNEKEQFIPNKKRIIFTGTLLTLIGFGEIVLGSLVISTSTGYYVGCVYTGIIIIIFLIKYIIDIKRNYDFIMRGSRSITSFKLAVKCKVNLSLVFK